MWSLAIVGVMSGVCMWVASLAYGLIDSLGLFLLYFGYVMLVLAMTSSLLVRVGVALRVDHFLHC